MIQVVEEIDSSPVIAVGELENSGVFEVLCEDMTVHMTDGVADEDLQSIEDVAMLIDPKKPIMTGNMRLRKEVQ